MAEGVLLLAAIKALVDQAQGLVPVHSVVHAVLGSNG